MGIHIEKVTGLGACPLDTAMDHLVGGFFSRTCNDDMFRDQNG